MVAIWRTASARSASRSFMSGLLGGHPRRCPLCGRCAVWWDCRRGSFPRPFTIYAGNVEDVSLGAGDFARALTNSERRNQRRGDGGQRGSGTRQDSAGQPWWARTERRTETGSSSKDYVGARDDAVNQRAPKSVEGKELAPQVGFEPTTLRLTAESSRALFRNIGSELHPVPLRGSAKTQWPGSGEQPVSVALGLARRAVTLCG